MNVDFDTIFHGAEVLAALPIAWKINRVLNRLLDQLEEFPLHRHVSIGGHEMIQYPRNVKID